MDYYFDGNLIDKHIDHTVAKAYSRIGLLFRGFVSRNLHVFRHVYITFGICVKCMVSHLLMHIKLLTLGYRKSTASFHKENN